MKTVFMQLRLMTNQLQFELKTGFFMDVAEFACSHEFLILV